ncbi:MAG: class I SAM-dependent methyltransferase [Novosphingobium sp.]|nr:class I SAM-dependent methyltransferase [Novosphingobium sp.]
MSSRATGRGEQLVAGGWRLATGPEWLERLLAGGVSQILRRIDAGMECGSIRATLPDGSQRVFGGRRPGFDATVRLNSYRALLRLATSGSVGCFQAWQRREWESPDPVSLFALFMANATSLGNVGRARGPWRWAMRVHHFLRRNTRAGSLRNIHAHYDLGNDFYAAWLDPTMAYSSARFATGDTLEEAQRRKLASIAARLAGARDVLEIGCGWGAMARYLADQGAQVTAISLSDEQLAFARAHHGHAAIEFRKQDYRDTQGQFDGIVSVEMVEAVGREYWPAFFDCIARNLKPGGRAAIQYIAMRDDLFADYARSADFIQAYIFPGGLLVSEGEFRKLAQERGLEWRDREGFGLDYAETLRQWRERFDRAVADRRLPADFDEAFIDLWRYYLMYCEGGFRGGGIDVAQATLVKRA